MDLLHELRADHWQARDLLTELREGGARARLVTLKKLGSWLKAHAEGESRSLDAFGKKHPSLRVQAYADQEEHTALQTFYEDALKARNPFLREARIHLFAEILERHLDEEEEEVFPLVAAELGATESEKLAHIYRAAVPITEAPPAGPTGLLRWLEGRPEPTPNPNSPINP